MSAPVESLPLIREHRFCSGERPLRIHHPVARAQRCAPPGEDSGIGTPGVFTEETQLAAAICRRAFPGSAPEQPREHAHGQEEAGPACDTALTDLGRGPHRERCRAREDGVSAEPQVRIEPRLSIFAASAAAWTARLSCRVLSGSRPGNSQPPPASCPECGQPATRHADARAAPVRAWRSDPCGPCPVRCAASCAGRRRRRPSAPRLHWHASRRHRPLTVRSDLQ